MLRVMFKSINLNEVADHVKTIYDSVRCNVCDKHEGLRMRYLCGHTSCDKCVDLSDSCSLCLTPPIGNARKPVVDIPLTERTKNAAKLLDSFKKNFDIDVLNRRRISEQLKVEKELFPQCIQAPSKYYNKRKSYQYLKSNKENRLSHLPGEDISETNSKMENSNDNVQKWINKYIVRKPFAELNPNDQGLLNDSGFHNVTVETTNKTRRSNRKRLLLDSSINKSIPNDVENLRKKRKLSKHNFKLTRSSKETFKACTSKDESGIVIDSESSNEGVIVINDSQPVIDKDLAAWLLVQQAEENETCKKAITITPPDQTTTMSPESAIKTSSKQILTSTPLQTEIKPLKPTETTSSELNVSSFFEKAYLNENIDINNASKPRAIAKIPFLKKGYLTEVCKYCIDEENSVAEPKDIFITVDNKTFTTVITVSKNHSYVKETNKHSTEVQTDITETYDLLKKNEKSRQRESMFVHENISSLKPSQDLFANDKRIANIIEEPVCKKRSVVIAESDSEEDVPSTTIEVVAQVHRSCNQMDYNILADIENMEEHSKRPRRGPRGLTPTSTDSSDKENFNPNRVKTSNTSKKKPKK